MEGQEIQQAVNQAFAGVARGFVGLLLSFRTFCQVLAFASRVIGGWLQPILYRDAGERTLRGLALWIVVGLFGWGLFCDFAGEVSEGHKVGASQDRVFMLAALWSIGLALADWRAAMNRRKLQKHIFSKFLGLPRLLPASVASYPLPPILVFVGGLILRTWNIDPVGGMMLMVSAAAVLVQLWTISALRREDAFDLLDANWLSDDRSQASAQLSGNDKAAASPRVARAVTTADLIRRYSA